MSDSAADDSTCLRLRALSGTLTRLGDALATGDLEALRAAEPALAAAASSLTLPTIRSNRSDVRDAIAEARTALARCRRLGHSLETFVACSLAAQGRGADYARDGRAGQGRAPQALIARG
jgi:hypothetical protein